MQSPERCQARFECFAGGQEFFERFGHFPVASFVEKPLRHAALPDVRIGEEFDQPGAAQLCEVHIFLRPAWHRCGWFVSDIYDAPDAAMLAIDAVGVRVRVLVTRIFVVPVHDPDRAVGPGLGAYRPEPSVARRQEILARRGLETGTVRREMIVVDRALMDVAQERLAQPLPGKLVALVNVHPGVGGHEMFVVHNGGEQFVGVGIGRRAALAHINTAGRHVKEMVDDARAHEGVAVTVEVHAPRIARAVSDDFKSLRARMEAGDGRVHNHTGSARIVWVFDC